MNNAAVLAARYARRPLLLTPEAARELAMRIRVLDERAFSRPGRLEAFLRKVGLGAPGRGERLAMEDADDVYGEPPPPIEERLAYAPRWAGEPDDVGYCWSLNRGVAMLCVDTPLVQHGEDFCGVVYHGYDTLLEAFREAEADDRVKAKFLRLDTPGGVVGSGLYQLGQFLQANREAAGGKPLWVYADMMCSAGYWVGSPGDRISAGPVGQVGSIGAVWVHEDWSGAYEKAGVVVTPIQFGAKKTDGADFQPLSPGAKADVQAEIDQLGRDFVGAVVSARPKLTAEGLIGTEAAVFLAQHDEPARSGLDLGFVDAIETEEQAFDGLLAHIATPTSGAKPGFRPAAAANALKEAPMSTAKTRKAAKTPSLAALQAQRAALDAQIAQLSADSEAGAADPPPAETAATAETDPCPDCDGTGEVDGMECDTCGGTGIDPEAGPGAQAPSDAPAAAAPAAAAAEPDAQAAAAAILASPEAETHPHAALAAVRDGLTLAQFKGQLAAQAKAPRGGRLGELLAHGPRLGPDAAQAAAGGLGGALLANAKARAEAAAGKRQ